MSFFLGGRASGPEEARVDFQVPRNGHEDAGYHSGRKQQQMDEKYIEDGQHSSRWTVDGRTGLPRFASPRFSSQRSQRAIAEQAHWYHAETTRTKPPSPQRRKGPALGRAQSHRVRKLKPEHVPEEVVPIVRTKSEVRLHMPLSLSQVKGIDRVKAESAFERSKTEALHEVKAESALEAVEELARKEGKSWLKPDSFRMDEPNLD